MHKAYTLIVDTREQNALPLKFADWVPFLKPFSHGQTTSIRLHVVEAPLKTGDYAIRGLEHVALVERKGSLRELAKNCLTSDVARFTHCLERLGGECRYPLLMVEGTPAKLLSDKSIEKPYTALDALQRLLLSYQIPLLLLPSNSARQRQVTGEYVARWLVNAAIVNGD
jgi:ERCC4-type nuclease